MKTRKSGESKIIPQNQNLKKMKIMEHHEDALYFIHRINLLLELVCILVTIVYILGIYTIVYTIYTPVYTPIYIPNIQ